MQPGIIGHSSLNCIRKSNKTPLSHIFILFIPFSFKPLHWTVFIPLVLFLWKPLITPFRRRHPYPVTQLRYDRQIKAREMDEVLMTVSLDNSVTDFNTLPLQFPSCRSQHTFDFRFLNYVSDFGNHSIKMNALTVQEWPTMWQVPLVSIFCVLHGYVSKSYSSPVSWHLASESL